MLFLETNLPQSMLAQGTTPGTSTGAEPDCEEETKQVESCNPRSYQERTRRPGPICLTLGKLL